MGFRLSLHEPNVSYTLHRDRGHNAAMYITADSVDLIVSMRIFVIVLKDFDRFVTSPNVLCACHTITYRYCAVFFLPFLGPLCRSPIHTFGHASSMGLCLNVRSFSWPFENRIEQFLLHVRMHALAHTYTYMQNNKIGTRIAYAIRWNLLFLLYALQ